MGPIYCLVELVLYSLVYQEVAWTSSIFLVPKPPLHFGLYILSQAIVYIAGWILFIIVSLLVFQKKFLFVLFFSLDKYFGILNQLMEYWEIFARFDLIRIILYAFERVWTCHLISFRPMLCLISSESTFVLLLSTFKQPR